MKLTTVTLREIEVAWFSAAESAIAEIAREQHDEQIYAAAFHLFYADDSKVLPPALAANTESAVVTHQEEDGYSWSTRWAPPEWRWDVLDGASNEMRPLYAELSSELNDATNTEWEEVLEQHDAVISRVARALTKAARDRVGRFNDQAFPDWFVVAVLEDQRGPTEYNRLVKASVDSEILQTLEGILVDE